MSQTCFKPAKLMVSKFPPNVSHHSWGVMGSSRVLPCLVRVKLLTTRSCGELLCTLQLTACTWKGWSLMQFAQFFSSGSLLGRTHGQTILPKETCGYAQLSHAESELLQQQQAPGCYENLSDMNVLDAAQDAAGLDSLPPARTRVFQFQLAQRLHDGMIQDGDEFAQLHKGLTKPLFHRKRKSQFIPSGHWNKSFWRKPRWIRLQAWNWINIWQVPSNTITGLALRCWNYAWTRAGVLAFLFPQPNIHYNQAVHAVTEHAHSSLTPDMLWWDFWLTSIWK